ncbi:chaperone modulator CbpM, partial [Parabacteroides johnsonii]
RMYYDLSINIEGIDAIHHLLGRVESLQQEVNRLKSKLRLYETENHDSIEDL